MPQNRELSFELLQVQPAAQLLQQLRTLDALGLAVLVRLGLADSELVRADAVRRLAAEARAGRRYDLVLIDPPYRMVNQSLVALAPYLASVLAPDGLVVVESGASEQPELPLPLRTSRTYGSTRLTVFEASE